MIILPLLCPKCDFRLDLPSDQPMATCPTCGVRLKPAGPVKYDGEEGRGEPKGFYAG